MTIAEFDHFDKEKKRQLLQQCCGSTAWIEKMINEPAAEDLVDLLEIAEEKWYECNENDWLEAFGHHPKIGDVESLQKKFVTTAHLASSEQSGINTASDTIIQQLAKGNEDYEKKFGYIFIVCATGKSAEEMLQILLSRLSNEPMDEIKIAADEQNMITRLRLQKMLYEPNNNTHS